MAFTVPDGKFSKRVKHRDNVLKGGEMSRFQYFSVPSFPGLWPLTWSKCDPPSNPSSPADLEVSAVWTLIAASHLQVDEESMTACAQRDDLAARPFSINVACIWPPCASALQDQFLLEEHLAAGPAIGKIYHFERCTCTTASLPAWTGAAGWRDVRIFSSSFLCGSSSWTKLLSSLKAECSLNE